MLYELCCLKYPFDTKVGLEDLIEKIKVGKFDSIPEMYSKDMRNIVASMLTVDPKSRPTIN